MRSWQWGVETAWESHLLRNIRKLCALTFGDSQGRTEEGWLPADCFSVSSECACEILMWHLIKISSSVNRSGILPIEFLLIFLLRVLFFNFRSNPLVGSRVLGTSYPFQWCLGESSLRHLEPLLLLTLHTLCRNYRSRKVEEDEYEDSSSNQKWVLAPKSQDTDVTLILNKLLREYDKKLRPDIGSECWRLLFQ